MKIVHALGCCGRHQRISPLRQRGDAGAQRRQKFPILTPSDPGVASMSLPTKFKAQVT